MHHRTAARFWSPPPPAALLRGKHAARDVPSFSSAFELSESGTGLPHSKTLSRPPCTIEPPPGFGVRPPLRRFCVANTLRETFRALAPRLSFPKAGQDSRTPRRYRDHHATTNRRQFWSASAPAALLRGECAARNVPSFSSAFELSESGTGPPHSKTLSRPPCT